jgi:hypothetical protein
MPPAAFSTLSIVSLVFLCSASAGAGVTAAKNSTTNAAPTQAGGEKAEKISGELQVGKAESVILYLGEESGDYAAYCFANDSEAGRAI